MIVSLIPKEAFRDQLATATAILVKQSAKIGTSKSIRYLTLRVVQ